jgi:peptidoglycan/LPS O-acetylase OafA/YrhL
VNEYPPPQISAEASHDRKPHYYWLDIIRFLAAFGVMAGHFRGSFFEEYGLLAAEDKTPIVLLFYLVTKLGHACVLVFFVLSGFLVGGKAIERMRDHKFRLGDYSIDRTVRIALPLISALLLYIPVSYYMGNPIHWWRWVGNLCSLQGVLCEVVVGPLWSLSYEVWFYILIGTIAVVLDGTNRQRILAWPCMLAVIFVFMHLKVLYLFIWLLGAASYLLMPKASNKITMILSSVWVVVCLIVLQMTGKSRAFEIPQLLDIRPAMEVLFSCSFCLFLQQLILHKPHKPWSIRLNRIGTCLAAFSYTLYLIHPLVQDLLTYMGAPKSESINLLSLMLYFAWLTVGMVVSYLVYLLFERNTNFLKQKIRNIINLN